MVPRTFEGKRTATHRIEVTNTGNAVVAAVLVFLVKDQASGLPLSGVLSSLR